MKTEGTDKKEMTAKEKEAAKQDKRRYPLLYKAARAAAWFPLRKYQFQTDKLPKTDEPYIVMANYLTEADIIMVARAFPQHMYYVAGEHLRRSKIGGLIEWAQHPIFEFKGAGAVEVVREITRRVKRGNNVIIFPEGSRSFNGETIKLPLSAAKIVKMAKCGLVTYRIEGGYFVAPRWAYTVRRGPVRGVIVHHYTAEEVKAMSAEQLLDAINTDLHENAYERQRKERFLYKGERLAEGLENYLVKCPVCGEFDTMVTADNEFYCTKCGHRGIYREDGFLEGKDLVYDNVYDWGKWAEEQTTAYIKEKPDDAVIFGDRNVKLYLVTNDHRQIDIFDGEVLGYKDRLEMNGEVFPFEKIIAMDMLYFGKTLLFTIDNKHLGITGERYHAIKYQKLYDAYMESHKK